MTQRKDGRWVKTIRYNNKKMFFYSSEDTEKKAERDINRQILAFKEKDFSEKHNFGKLMEQVVEYAEENNDYYTWQSYKNAARYLEDLSDEDIEDVSPLELQAILDEMAGKDYSISLIKKVKCIISLVYDKAILNGAQIMNFSKSLKVPKSAKKPKKILPLTNEEIKKVIDGADLPFGMFAYLLCFTGMRPEELLAIRKYDVKLKEDIISINKVVSFRSNASVIEEAAKTDLAVSDITIMPFIKDKLKSYMKGMREDDFLFGGEKSISKTAYRKRWEKYKKLSGLEITPYQCRHTFSQLAYKSSVDVKTHQALMRHANVQTSLNTYTDFDRAENLKNVGKINTYIEETF